MVGIASSEESPCIRFRMTLVLYERVQAASKEKLLTVAEFTRFVLGEATVSLSPEHLRVSAPSVPSSEVNAALRQLAEPWRW